MKLLKISEVENTQIIEEFSCLLTDYLDSQEKLREIHKKMDEFLKEQALHDHLNYLVRTYLLIEDESVIGYFSLYNEAVKVTAKKKKELNKVSYYFYRGTEYDIYPAVRLHQFAISRDFQGKMFEGVKYSDHLMGEVFNVVRELSESSGCLILGLEATENAMAFYESYDFITLLKSNGVTLPYMIFKTTDLFN